MKTSHGAFLVTGGAGFIGSHLCNTLVRRGEQVTVVDNLSYGKSENIKEISDKIALYELDVRDTAFKDLLLTGDFGVIFHLAGNASVPISVENPDYDFKNNLLATFQLLEIIRRSGLDIALIVASSAAVYGNPSSIPISETDLTLPISPYGISKLAMERYVSAYSRLYGLKAASLRPFSAYGPRLRKQIVYDFIRKLSQNPGELIIIGDGNQVRDFIYVDDIIRAALVVLENTPLNGEVYNVASGRGYSTREIAELLANSMDLSPEFHYTGNIRPGEPDKWIASIDKLRMQGFVPQVSLEEGLRKTVEWYQSAHNLTEE